MYVSVGSGEIIVNSEANTILVAYGLGSSIVIIMNATELHLGGMLNAALPEKTNNNKAISGKFGTSGFNQLIGQLPDQGAINTTMIARLAGGESLFPLPAIENIAAVGSRNVETARPMLAQENLELAGMDVGSQTGRTLRFFIESGLMTVSRLGMSPHTLGLHRNQKLPSRTELPAELPSPIHPN